MKLAVIGIGYVGKALAEALSKNHSVYAFDIDSEKGKNLDARIQFVSSMEEALVQAEFTIIAVPTNYNESSHQFDVSKVFDVVEQIQAINKETTIVIKSTVPVGFTRILQQSYPCSTILFCPEFLRENKALEDVLHPARIVVGYEQSNRDSEDKSSRFATIMKNLSSNLDIPVLMTGFEEAEAIKLFSNTFLALRISYFNELDSYALHHHLNSEDIIRGVCMDPRIGEGYNNPSFGYGGYCLPKDTKQLLHNFDAVPQNLIEATIKSNATRKEAIAKEIVRLAKKQANPKVGIYRLSMKLGSDNFRQSAILDILPLLRGEGLELCLYEPLIHEKEYLGIPLINNVDEFLSASTLIVANRVDETLRPCRDKVFTRDLFHQN